MSILIADDEKEIADLVALILEQEGYHTLTFYDSGEALSEITQNDGIELAVLDVMMPPPDGFALCKEIRKNHTYPIIMLTAKAEERDRVEGLSIGADDYVTKPFYPLELAARVRHSCGDTAGLLLKGRSVTRGTDSPWIAICTPFFSTGRRSSLPLRSSIFCGFSAKTRGRWCPPRRSSDRCGRRLIWTVITT
jgi:DNA-binding response OmpR family regulator